VAVAETVAENCDVRYSLNKRGNNEYM